MVTHATSRVLSGLPHPEGRQFVAAYSNDGRKRSVMLNLVPMGRGPGQALDASDELPVEAFSAERPDLSPWEGFAQRHELNIDVVFQAAFRCMPGAW